MNENKKDIIDTTARLIREKGYGNVTVQDICREAFVARSTFYYRFKSIDDMVDQMFRCPSPAWSRRTDPARTKKNDRDGINRPGRFQCRNYSARVSSTRSTLDTCS